MHYQLFSFSLINSLSCTTSSPLLAGPVKTFPSQSYRAPWQGQSHVCSARFQLTVHFRCVHVGLIACSFPLSSLNKAIFLPSYFTTLPSPFASPANSSNFSEGIIFSINSLATSRFSFTNFLKPAIGFMRLGLKSSLYSFLPFSIRSLKTIAETVPYVIPFPLKPVAT